MQHPLRSVLVFSCLTGAPLLGQQVISTSTSINTNTSVFAELRVVNDATLTIGRGGSWSTVGQGVYVGLPPGTPQSGSLVVADGGSLFSGSAAIGSGSAPGKSGTATVTGSGSLWSNQGALWVAASGTGSLRIEAGAEVYSGGSVVLGAAPGGVGTVTITGTFSALRLASTSGSLLVGQAGTGVLTLSRGGSVIAANGTNSLALGLQAGTAGGTVNIGAAAGDAADAAGFANVSQIESGGGTALLQFNTTGTAGSPTYFTKSGTATGDGVNVTGATRLVHTAGHTVVKGSLGHTGGTVINGGTLQIGNGGTAGSLTGNVTNQGTLAFSRSDAVTFGGVVSGTGGLRQLGAGTLTLSGTNTYTGTTAVEAGTLRLGASHVLADSTAVTVASGATVDVNGLTETVGTLAGAGRITLGAGNLTTLATADTTFAGVLSGTGGFTKAGTGALTLAGANTFTGTLAVNAGTLRLTGTLATGSTTTVAAGARLTGGGRLGNLVLGGTYAPGDSPALVALDNFTMNAGSLLQLEIGGLARGTQYDALDIAGTFAAAGTLAVSFIDGFAPTAAATFNLFDFTTATGTFATLSLPALAAGLTWDTSALSTLGELRIAATPPVGSAIPEPATGTALLGVTALGLAAWRRCRRRRA